MKVSLFITYCNKSFPKAPKRIFEVFLLHYVIKSVITKNLQSIQIFSLLFSKLLGKERIIGDVIVT